MNWIKAESLLDRYYAGLTSQQEEEELRQLLLHPELPAHLQQDASLLRHLQQAADEKATLSDEALFAKVETALAIEKPTSRPLQISVKIILQMAAAVALLLIGYGAGTHLNPENTRVNEQTAQLMQIRQEVQEMKLILNQNSPSQRIKAVSGAQYIGTSSEMIQALIQTMHFDENVNVRIAAIRALTHYRELPEVRLALIHTLGIQQDPNVQLQLIDALVEMNEKKAVPQMKELLKNNDLQETVRLRLQESIGLLI